jgi:NADH dehydrogenase
MIHAVTGAFGYSGKYIAQRLLDSGQQVITLTNSTNKPNPFGAKVKAYPLSFDNSAELANSLKGVSVLYNTYWVRFNHGSFSHAQAVENTRRLFAAAKAAGVERIVHVSITNPSVDSPFEYFRGKARLEQSLMDSGLSYAILRPAVLFGKEDILINNIAWMLRRLPIFGVFGSGEYRLQPIYVDDLACLAVKQGQNRENVIVNAIGPETFAYRELVETLGKIIGAQRPIISVPPWAGYVAGSIVGRLVGDVTITWEEIGGLMADLLYVNTPAAGPTKLTDWAREHAETLGKHYASELARRKA